MEFPGKKTADKTQRIKCVWHSVIMCWLHLQRRNRVSEKILTPPWYQWKPKAAFSSPTWFWPKSPSREGASGEVKYRAGIGAFQVARQTRKKIWISQARDEWSGIIVNCELSKFSYLLKSQHSGNSDCRRGIWHLRDKWRYLQKHNKYRCINLLSVCSELCFQDSVGSPFHLIAQCNFGVNSTARFQPDVSAIREKTTCTWKTSSELVWNFYSSQVHLKRKICWSELENPWMKLQIFSWVWLWTQQSRVDF